MMLVMKQLDLVDRPDGERKLHRLYLTALVLFGKAGPITSNRLLDWVLKMVAVYTLCFAFYFCFERPSHQAARWLGEKILGARARLVRTSS